ncbi:MAG: hypothetical protein AB7I42_22755 [Bradyrhizobium sp.]|uniref:hypothetical protein n=1 Tax=Bradyrhizobium sp. TaxID=376 RepID=UPI003D1110D7
MSQDELLAWARVLATGVAVGVAAANPALAIAVGQLLAALDALEALAKGKEAAPLLGYEEGRKRYLAARGLV